MGGRKHPLHNSPERTEDANAAIGSTGGTWEAFLVTIGRYDGLAIAGVPNDATAAEAVLTRLLPVTT
jgi:uncharacterized protein with GYD domain